ncbi:NAD(P)-dependent dehydrogenase, short-chain alcohol dehydrogenase family [Tistlia consotensis]|uniref:NAD(P)-dependent dehydrogenase, short-chain alcohol dehydrogenase family n=1 Tax=Tistlia consotensis USBA 355 TaxID=560819 RepID=A0A1Y6CMX3_9PROT|nr:SDR family oxidoreductase [Tistlia consotensis]SMF76189.1 NAD(P)-dependent dehydrogenase, short-chain alcohol dehydrogenase family [Tistlia consotensis USBA 355]SNS12416.1 NAD(P)-dependent dehydrogenase, short-chain alcohol dehydrogenase family [Tistlia consotensis]
MKLFERMRPRAGLRVLVTAGAAGIGAVIAEAFLEAGARVLVCDLDAEALGQFAARHPEAATTLADVADPAAVERLFAEVAARLGGLDVLVNNAGISGPTGPIDQLPVEEIRRTLDVDLLGQFLVVRLAAPLLRAGGEGAIVNLSSVAGRLGYGLRTPYAAAKWGVIGLTASLAKELGPEGIRVNAILPGVVRGARIERVIRDRAAAAGLSYEEMEAQYLKLVSLRRMVEPEDVAAMALFLCSPAGASISGQALSVCGNVETL